MVTWFWQHDQAAVFDLIPVRVFLKTEVNPVCLPEIESSSFGFFAYLDQSHKLLVDQLQFCFFRNNMFQFIGFRKQVHVKFAILNRDTSSL